MVDETLPQLPEQDVDFDMNEVVVEEKEVVDEDYDDSSDTEDDKEYTSIGWIKEGE